MKAVYIKKEVEYDFQGRRPDQVEFYRIMSAMTIGSLLTVLLFLFSMELYLMIMK